MKTRKFWAIYISMVALGLGVFYAFAGSIKEVPLALSEAEMQNLFGGDADNAKCVGRTGCYPNPSGCNNQTGKDYSGSLSWEQCYYQLGKRCNQDENSNRIVCTVTNWTNTNCTGTYTTDQWNMPQYCTTSDM